MKKLLSIILCLAMIFSLAACGSKEEEITIGKLKEFQVGDYKLNLPETYELNDLEEVKAEPNCIAMLTDSKGKLPDLWIYEDECQGTTIKEHIMNMDAEWDYNEMSYYSKGDANFAKTVYDEDWYGQKLVNEHYYKIGNDAKVLSFDFAYPAADDAQLAHNYIVAIAEALGF